MLIITLFLNNVFIIIIIVIIEQYYVKTKIGTHGVYISLSIHVILYPLQINYKH